VKRSMIVDIAGQKLTLKTDAEESYVKSLARFVTDKIDEAKRGSKGMATQSVAILAAMHIADDLFQSRRSEKDFRRVVKEKSKSILDLLEKESA